MAMGMTPRSPILDALPGNMWGTHVVLDIGSNSGMPPFSAAMYIYMW